MIESLVEVAAFVVVLGVSAMWAVRTIHAHGRLRGIKEAMREMACGVGSTYQAAGTPAPENVRRSLDAVRHAAALARGEPKRAAAVVRTLRELGRAMGTAARLSGYEEGARPRNNEIRVDITLRDLLMVRWLAHAGFKLMMGNETGAKFCFRNETDAQESNFALDRLEWRLSQEHTDPTAPHALALCRQKMIWERWPEGNAATAETRKAA